VVAVLLRATTLMHCRCTSTPFNAREGGLWLASSPAGKVLINSFGLRYTMHRPRCWRRWQEGVSAAHWCLEATSFATLYGVTLRNRKLKNSGLVSDFLLYGTGRLKRSAWLAICHMLHVVALHGRAIVSLDVGVDIRTGQRIKDCPRKMLEMSLSMAY
jgi:hypothetical protein